MDPAEKELRDALARMEWNISAAARLLNLSRQGVYKQMERYGIRVSTKERRATISAIMRKSVQVRWAKKRKGRAA